MRSPRRTRVPTRVLGALAAITLLGVAVAGCGANSSGSNDSASTMSEPAPANDDQRGTLAESAADGSDFGALDSASGLSINAASAPSDTDTPDRSIISTGNIALKSDDVAQARFDVQKVVDKFRGEVSQEKTETDDEGDVNRSRLVVRIPTEDFADAMESLAGAADLISSDTNTDDVTTKVIDNEIRVRVQRRSIARIELLLDRAQSIRDIVNIESQLSRRQAQLGSLERQQAYLADQTAMSTITISLERTEKKEVAEKKKDDDSGFIAGLDSGWNGLTTVAVGLATVTGALLPFAVVLLLLAIPGYPLARRLRRRTTPEPTPAA